MFDHLVECLYRGHWWRCNCFQCNISSGSKADLGYITYSQLKRDSHQYTKLIAEEININEWWWLLIKDTPVNELWWPSCEILAHKSAAMNATPAVIRKDHNISEIGIDQNLLSWQLRNAWESAYVLVACHQYLIIPSEGSIKSIQIRSIWTDMWRTITTN